MPRKILIVDDDPDVILFLSTVLQDHGYEPLEARNGREGFLKVKAELPDLILLDLMMPEKSGIAMLNELKLDDQLKKIPVIMVTGVSGETGIDLESFFRKKSLGDGEDAVPGPEGFLEKPVDPQHLLALIEEVLS